MGSQEVGKLKLSQFLVRLGGRCPNRSSRQRERHNRDSDAGELLRIAPWSTPFVCQWAHHVPQNSVVSNANIGRIIMQKAQQ